MSTELYTIIFQRGGTDNATWHKTALSGTYQEMEIKRLEETIRGIRCYNKSVLELRTCGMPEGPSPLGEVTNDEIERARHSLAAALQNQERAR